jgi:hypothetical protein
MIILLLFKHYLIFIQLLSIEYDLYYKMQHNIFEYSIKRTKFK